MNACTIAVSFTKAKVKVVSELESLGYENLISIIDWDKVSLCYAEIVMNPQSDTDLYNNELMSTLKDQVIKTDVVEYLEGIFRDEVRNILYNSIPEFFRKNWLNNTPGTIFEVRYLGGMSILIDMAHDDTEEAKCFTGINLNFLK